MENLVFFIATSLLYKFVSHRKIVHAVSPANLWRHLNHPAFTEFEKTTTVTGDTLYFKEHKDSDVTFGMICVELQKPHSIQASSEILVNYINKLRGPFFIFHQTGLTDHPQFSTDDVSVVEYWQDAVGIDYKIKGYSNGDVLCVLYVKNISVCEVLVQDDFLNGFQCTPAAMAA